MVILEFINIKTPNIYKVKERKREIQRQRHVEVSFAWDNFKDTSLGGILCVMCYMRINNRTFYSRWESNFQSF